MIYCSHLPHDLKKHQGQLPDFLLQTSNQHSRLLDQSYISEDAKVKFLQSVFNAP